MTPETIRSSFTMAALGAVLALFDFSFNGASHIVRFIWLVGSGADLGLIRQITNKAFRDGGCNGHRAPFVRGKFFHIPDKCSRRAQGDRRAGSSHLRIEQFGRQNIF